MSAGVVYLKFYDSEIILDSTPQQFTEGRSHVSSQFFAGANLQKLATKKEAFKSSLTQNCSVDNKATDRVLFYYGDTENPTDCSKSEYRTVGLRLWKVCPQGIYEVTLGPIDVTDGIEIYCSK